VKSYKVFITETLQMEVDIEAKSRSEAVEIAERNWNNSDYILDADHFKGVTFEAEKPVRKREYER